MPYKDPAKRRSSAVERQTLYLKRNSDKAKAKKRGWYARHRKERIEKAVINAQDWRNNNPERMKEIRRNWERKKRAERDAAAPRPRPDRCEICKEFGKVVYDHDHVSGEFRTWACDRCNRIMGAVKDDPEILRAIADHLEAFFESLKNVR